MTLVRITDPATRQPVEFDAETSWHASTRSRGRPRWVALSVHKVRRDDGTPGWVYVKAGMSVIYHADPTTCMTAPGRQRGRPAIVDDLPDDAEPCPACNPPAPDELADAADAGTMITVRYEWPRLTVVRLATPAEVVAAATIKQDRDRAVSVRMSEPVADLLAQAMTDPDFRAGAGMLPAAV